MQRFGSARIVVDKNRPYKFHAFWLRSTRAARLRPCILVNIGNLEHGGKIAIVLLVLLLDRNIDVKSS